MVHTPDQQTETWLQRAGIRNDKEAYMNLLQRLGVPLWIQAACFRTLARLGVRVHPRDAELVARFDRNRGVFETIRTMLCEDSHLTYVGYLKTRVAGEDRARTPENPGIPPERWDRYRQLMREVGVIAVSHVGDTITMRVSTCGSSSKGIVYSPAHRVVVSSLERYPLPPEQHAHLILDEPWHIYYGWES
jgi:hypothetical protein